MSFAILCSLWYHRGHRLRIFIYYPGPGPKLISATVLPGPGPKLVSALLLPGPGPKLVSALLLPGPGPKLVSATLLPGPGPKLVSLKTSGVFAGVFNAASLEMSG
jgi:hypothetical protein